MSSYDPRLIGNNLRLLRGSRTQKQMSELSDMHVSMWGQLERGRAMALPTFFKLCEIFNWDAGQVLGLKPLTLFDKLESGEQHRKLRESHDIKCFHKGHALYIQVGSKNATVRTVEWSETGSTVETQECEIHHEGGKHFYYKGTKIELL